MAADDSHTLEGALRTLRRAVKGQHKFEGAVRELEKVATAMNDEATRATLPAQLDPAFLDDDDESERPHQPTSEEKEHLGNTCLTVLASLLKLDLEAAFLPPTLLRKVFDLFSAATAHHPSNKTRLSNL
ncbi:hypothetical protein JCM10213_000195, partial [Rhodosporidiobolus nylandii]